MFILGHQLRLRDSLLFLCMVRQQRRDGFTRLVELERRRESDGLDLVDCLLCLCSRGGACGFCVGHDDDVCVGGWNGEFA